MAQYSDSLLLAQGVINHAPLSGVKNINAVFEHQSYDAWDMLTRDNRMVQRNGTEIRVLANSSFGGDDEVVDPDPEITYSNSDKPKTLTYPWAGSASSYQIGEQEADAARTEAGSVTGNSKSAREKRAQVLLDFVNWRRFEAVRRFPEGLCNRFFQPKDTADNARRHLGLFDFARMAPDDAGPGTADYVGYTRRFGDSGWTTGLATSTTLGGLDMSTTANKFGANFALVYDLADFGGSRFFNHFELMRTKLGFKPPSNVSGMVDKKPLNFGIYCGTNLYIQLGEQERTAGKAYGLTRGADGQLKWMNIPVYDEPRLNANPFNPFVWVNWSYWKFFVREGWWLKEKMGTDTPNPTILKTAIISEYQPICENLRYGVGVMHTTVT